MNKRRFFIGRKWPGGNRKEIRAHLAKITGWICFWCLCPVKEYDIPGGNGPGKPPDDQATLDHVIHKHFRKKGEKTPKVLSCVVCNIERQKMYDKFSREIGRSPQLKNR